MTQISMPLYNVLRKLNIDETEAHNVASDVVTVDHIDEELSKLATHEDFLLLRADIEKFKNDINTVVVTQARWFMLTVLSAAAVTISAVAALKVFG